MCSAYSILQHYILLCSIRWHLEMMFARWYAESFKYSIMPFISWTMKNSSTEYHFRFRFRFTFIILIRWFQSNIFVIFIQIFLLFLSFSIFCLLFWKKKNAITVIAHAIIEICKKTKFYCSVNSVWSVWRQRNM